MIWRREPVKGRAGLGGALVPVDLEARRRSPDGEWEKLWLDVAEAYGRGDGKTDMYHAFADSCYQQPTVTSFPQPSRHLDCP
jgi:hypothetical protein